MSASVVILGLFSVVWGAWGLLFVIMPTQAITWTKSFFFDVGRRFWIALAVLLIGLLLIIGTESLEGRWLWVACGGISVLKACWLLGASESCRDRAWQYCSRWPTWLLRCDGVIILALAVLLAADLMLHG